MSWLLLRLVISMHGLKMKFETGMDIKKASMANMKLFSQGGIRIIPGCNSSQSKLIHSNPIRTKRRRREASFHTHRRYQENSQQEVNDCSTCQMVRGMRCLICSHKGEWWNLGMGTGLENVRLISIFLTLTIRTKHTENIGRPRNFWYRSPH